MRAFTGAIDRALKVRRELALCDLRASQADKKTFEAYLKQLQQ